MKIKRIIPAAIACLLFTGCAENQYKTPKVNYSDMFVQKTDTNNTLPSEDETAETAVKNSFTANAPAINTENGNGSAETPSVGKNETTNKAYAANGEIDETEQSNANPDADIQTFADTEANTNPDTQTTTIGNRKTNSVIYTDDQAVANLPLGDICYFPYKTASELKPPNENVVKATEPGVSTDEDEDTSEFTAGITQSAADEINTLDDDKVKELKDVIENISVIAPNNAGLNEETKLYVAPDVSILQNPKNKGMFLDLEFIDEENKKIQPQQNVTLNIPVPSNLKNNSDILVYRIGNYNTPEKTEFETQTINGADYIVLETNQLGTYVITNAEIKKSDVDRLKSVNNRRTNEETKYDYGYRVVFRTNTDTYLLGIFPHDLCEWNEVNDVCREIENKFESDCQMVGAPSLEDLEYFTKCGIYLPGQYEMWTSTPISEQGNKAYYRNQKGAFYSTRSKSEKCGVCAIIRVSAPQDDPELLSSFLPDYEETKARLEAEEAQYKQSAAEQ